MGMVDPVRRSIAGVLGAALLGACGAASGADPAASASPVPAASATAGVPLHTPPTLDVRTVTARDQDNGHALSVHVGDQVQVVLASTYWRMQGSSDPAVLRPAAEPAVSPQPSGCVPGQGCGTVTERFDAVTAGRADVTATRNSCGEALACTGPQRTYRIMVLVVG